MVKDLHDYIKEEFTEKLKSDDAKYLKRFMKMPTNIIDIDTIYCRYYDNIKMKLVKGNKIYDRGFYKLEEEPIVARVFLRPTSMFISSCTTSSEKRFKIQFYIKEIHKLDDLYDTYVDDDGNVQRYDKGEDSEYNINSNITVVKGCDDNSQDEKVKIKKYKKRKESSSDEEDND